LDKLFTSFQFQILLILPSSSGKNKITFSSYKLSWMANRSNYLLAAEFMASLLVNSSNQTQYEEIWSKIETLLKL
jgi:hypothetical protein